MIEVIDGVEVKYCPRCDEHVPIEDFYRHKGKPDGLRGYCKSCYREYKREYSDTNREHMREYAREYYDTNRDHYTQWKHEYYQNNPDKYRQNLFARRLNAAVYSGKIIKPDSCTLCHSTENIQGHHPSYEPGHELDIIWLCALCHAKLHIQLRHEEDNGGPILE